MSFGNPKQKGVMEENIDPDYNKLDDIHSTIARSKECLSFSSRSYSETLTLVEQKTKELEQKGVSFQDILRSAEDKIKAIESPIKLNVGGKTKGFTISKTNLFRFENSLFYFLFACGKWKPDDKGFYFIDRDPKEFTKIMDYLRTGDIEQMNNALKKELNYFKLPIFCWNDKSEENEPSLTVVRVQEVDDQSTQTKKDKSIEKYSEAYELLLLTLKNIENQMEKITTKLQKFQEDIENASVVAENLNEPIRLNIGGTIFMTTKQTLTKHEDSMLCSIASGRWKADFEGSYFVDRNPELFKPILEYLRTGNYDSKGDQKNKRKLELDFYQVEIEQRSNKKQMTYQGQCVATFTGHSRRITSLIELSNGQLASSGFDNTIKIWNMNGQCTNILTGHNGGINLLIELSNGQLASTGFDDNTIKVWNMNGQCSATFTGHNGGISSLIELSNGQLASASREIKIWM